MWAGLPWLGLGWELTKEVQGCYAELGNSKLCLNISWLENFMTELLSHTGFIIFAVLKFFWEPLKKRTWILSFLELCTDDDLHVLCGSIERGTPNLLISLNNAHSSAERFLFTKGIWSLREIGGQMSTVMCQTCDRQDNSKAVACVPLGTLVRLWALEASVCTRCLLLSSYFSPPFHCAQCFKGSLVLCILWPLRTCWLFKAKAGGKPVYHHGKDPCRSEM